MRRNDRAIREELRREAMSVPIPDDMWANISKELDQDLAARARSAVQARPLHRSTRGVQMRQMLAIGAAAGIFWMMVIPSGAYVDRLQQPAPNAAEASQHLGETPWDIPTEAQIEKPPKARPSAPVSRGGVDGRRGSLEIVVSR